MTVLSFVCSEYLALFKKTVAMHEVFLQRIAAHAAMREDYNFRVFLEYGDEVRTVIGQGETITVLSLHFV